jgi:hypothetical protein
VLWTLLDLRGALPQLGAQLLRHEREHLGRHAGGELRQHDGRDLRMLVGEDLRERGHARRSQELERLGGRRCDAEEPLGLLGAERPVGELPDILRAAAAHDGEWIGEVLLEVLEHALDHVAPDRVELLDCIDQAPDVGVGHASEDLRGDLLVERKQGDGRALRTVQRDVLQDRGRAHDFAPLATGLPGTSDNQAVSSSAVRSMSPRTASRTRSRIGL